MVDGWLLVAGWLVLTDLVTQVHSRYSLQEKWQKQHLVQVKQELSVAEQEREAAQSRLQCAVCVEAERNTVLLPCSHVVACAGCATRLTQCPVCRATIHSRVMARMS